MRLRTGKASLEMARAVRPGVAQAEALPPHRDALHRGKLRPIPAPHPAQFPLVVSTEGVIEQPLRGEAAVESQLLAKLTVERAEREVSGFPVDLQQQAVREPEPPRLSA